MIQDIIVAIIIALALGVALAVILNLLNFLFSEKKSKSIIKFLNQI